MSDKHTPGPWVFSFESTAPEWAIITTEGGSVIANVNADHRQEANVRLIAAAPDLFALVIRYRHETPLGNQPHMIAHEADSVIARAAGAAS